MYLRSWLAVVVFAIGAAAAAAQTTWFVDDDAVGDPGPLDSTISDPLEDGSSQHPFDGIQEALAVAVSGDTVLVLDGRYTGPDNRNLNFTGKVLTLRSENGPDVTIIDVEQTEFSRAMNFVSGEGPASVVQGLTMMGGRPTYDTREIVTLGLAHGGAVYCVDSSPTFIDCVFRDNAPFGEYSGVVVGMGATGGESSGGGLRFERSRSVLLGCVVRDNRPERSGGPPNLAGGLLGAGISAVQSDLVLQDCLIEGNWFAQDTCSGGDTGGGGGGIGSSGGSLTLLDCTIRANRAPNGGCAGGQLFESGEGGAGGGVYVRNGMLDMRRCTIVDNLSGRGRDYLDIEARDGGAGGGIYLQGATAAIRESFVAGNRAGAGGALFRSKLFSTSGDGGSGGGLAAVNSQVDVINCVLARNASGPRGEGEDAGANGQGAGVAAVDNSVVNLLQVTCVENALSTEGENPPEQDAGVYQDASSILVGNSIVWGNRPRNVDPGDAAIAITFSIVEGGFAGTGNLDADPQFADAPGPDLDPNAVEDNNYRPMAGAAGNDAGSNALVDVAIDLDGAARIADDLLAADLCGAVCVDMGAYELGNGAPAGDDCDEPLAADNDCDGNGVVDRCELATRDCDGNGLIDACEAADGTLEDCNNNGVPDACDADCDRDGVPDECQLADGADDCNGNGVLDACEFGDCNQNGVLDSCEIADIPNLDCNGNLVPDVCEGFEDCDNNGVADACELADGTATDCDEDGVIDSCQTEGDCDANGRPDVCEIADGTITDCNANGLIDACETDNDCDRNGIPDDCDEDCDGDGIADACEVSAVRSGFALRFPGGTSRLGYSGATGCYGISGAGITIEAWVRPEGDPGAAQTIVQKLPNNYWLRLVDERVRFSYRGDETYTYDTDPVVVADTWQHIAVVHRFGDETIQVYRNGEPVNGAWTQVPASVPRTNFNPLFVGNSNNQQTPLVGLLDDVRIWRIERTGEQIRNSLTRPFGNVPRDLAALLRLEEGAGQPEESVCEASSTLEGTTWQPLVNCAACADLTDDGVVDLQDLAILLSHFGQAGSALDGDLSGDGRIDTSDLALLLRQFGASC